MQPEPASLTELFEFVVEQAPQALPLRRAKIYRGLASIIGNERDARELVNRAKQCERLEQDCRQLKLNFGRRAGRDGS